MHHATSLPTISSESASPTKNSHNVAPSMIHQQQSNNKSSYLPSPTRITQPSKSQNSLFSSPSKKSLLSRSPPPLQEIANQNALPPSSFRTSYRARPIYSMKDLLGTQQQSQKMDCDDDTFSCDNSPCISKAPSFASNNHYWSSSSLSTSTESLLLHKSSSNLLSTSTRKLRDLSPLQRRQSTISEVSATSSQPNSPQLQPHDALQKQPSCIQKDQEQLRALLLHTSPLYSPRSSQRMKQLEQLLDHYENEQLKPIMESVQALQLQMIKEKEETQSEDATVEQESKFLFQPVIVSKKPFSGPSTNGDDGNSIGLEEIKEMESGVSSAHHQQQQQQAAQVMKLKKVSMFVTATRSSLFMNHLRKKSMDFQHQLQQKQWQQKIKRIVQRLMTYITYHCDTSQGKVTVAQLVQVLCHPPEIFLQKYFHRVHRLQWYWQRQHIASYLLHAPTHLEHDHVKQHLAHIASNPPSPSSALSSHHSPIHSQCSSPHNHNKTRTTLLKPAPHNNNHNHHHHLSLLHQQHLQKAASSLSTSTSHSSLSTASTPRSPSSHALPHTTALLTSPTVAASSAPKLKRRSLRQHLNTTADPSVIAHIPKSLHFASEPSNTAISPQYHPTLLEISPFTKQVVDYIQNNTTWWTRSPLTMLHDMIVHNHKHSDVSVAHWFDALVPPFPLEDVTFPQATTITLASFVNAVSVISGSYFTAINFNIAAVDPLTPPLQQPAWSEVDIVFLFFLLTLPHYPTYHVVYERFVQSMFYVSEEKPFGTNAELYTVEQYRRIKLQDKVTSFLETEGNTLTISRYSLTYALSSVPLGKTHPEEDVHTQHIYLFHSKWMQKRTLFQQNLAFHLTPHQHHHQHGEEDTSVTSNVPGVSSPPKVRTQVDVTPLQSSCPVFDYLWDVTLIHHEIFHVSLATDKHTQHHPHHPELATLLNLEEEDDDESLFADELKDHPDSPKQHPTPLPHSNSIDKRGFSRAQSNHLSNHNNNNNHAFCERLHVTRQIRALATTLLHDRPEASSPTSAPSRVNSIHNLQHLLAIISRSPSASPVVGKEAKRTQMVSELTRFILRQHRHLHRPVKSTKASTTSHSQQATTVSSDIPALDTTAVSAAAGADAASPTLLLSLQGDVTRMLTTLCTLFLQHQQEKKLLHAHVDTLTTTSTAAAATFCAPALTESNNHHQHHQHHQLQHPPLTIDTTTQSSPTATEDDPFRLLSSSPQGILSPKIQAYLQTVSATSSSSTDTSYSSAISPTTSSGNQSTTFSTFNVGQPGGNHASLSPKNPKNTTHNININNNAFLYRSGEEKARFLLQSSPFKK